MNGPTFRPVTLSPHEATLDATPIDGDAPAGRKRCVALVDGDQCHLSGETQQLLRGRLRAASLVLCFGFWVFLIRNFFVLPVSQGSTLFLSIFHAVVVVVLGFCAITLCRKCPSSPRILRFKELLIFSLPAAFILAYQYLNTTNWQQHGYIESPAAPWVILIFTYAMFIPNSWQRAAVVIGLMALAPELMYVTVWLQQTSVNNVLSLEQVISLALMMSLAAATSVFGVYTIGRLRREAFEARQLGQYRLRHLIGSGGMGEVYLAEHQMMKRPCAIKVIRPGKANDPNALARFEREVRAMARLSHWNTVEVFDYGRTDDGTFYYVMEYLPGLSLAELVDLYGPLAPERVVSLLEQTCDALGEAHAQGLVHRDIKPGNIFAAQRGGIYDVAKLLDFGLAKPVLPDSDSSDLTLEGSITGSPLYMSPEQASDNEPDARSDIYALGAVGYFLLTGRPPFNGDKPMKVLVAHIRDDVIPPSRHQPSIPADLEAIVMRCLAKDPRDRYQDTAQLATALKATTVAGLWTRQRAARWWEQHSAGEIEPRSAHAAEAMLAPPSVVRPLVAR